MNTAAVNTDTVNTVTVNLGTVNADTVVMGVLNVTPDSFSDGGKYVLPDAAIRHGEQLAAEGADIVDIGGESTRPGAHRVPVDEEQARVLPVVRALAAAGIAVSIDTMNASTARAAADAGAAYINDVSGGLNDEAMVQVAIDTDLPYIAMHWRGHSAGINSLATYCDAADEVRTELFERAGELLDAGVKRERLIIDPGLGFAKNAEHNWQVLGHLRSFTGLGLPVLIGPSRKRFLTAIGTDVDTATAVVCALAVRSGAWGVRVHDVAATRTAVAVAAAWSAGERG